MGPYLSLVKTIKCLFFVSVPPGRPLIHNERGILVETTLGPYNEGSKLRLTCSVSGGKIYHVIFLIELILIFVFQYTMIVKFPLNIEFKLVRKLLFDCIS